VISFSFVSKKEHRNEEQKVIYAELTVLPTVCLNFQYSTRNNQCPRGKNTTCELKILYWILDISLHNFKQEKLASGLK